MAVLQSPCISLLPKRCRQLQFSELHGKYPSVFHHSKALVECATVDIEHGLMSTALLRGRSPKTLDGLRRRIAGHFLALCKTPAFNPEATKLRLVPGGQNEPEAFEYADDLIDAAT